MRKVPYRLSAAPNRREQAAAPASSGNGSTPTVQHASQYVNPLQQVNLMEA